MSTDETGKKLKDHGRGKATGDGGSFVKITHAELDEGLVLACGGTTEFTVYCFLKRFRRHEPGHEHHGLAWPHPEKIAAKIGLHEGTVAKAIRRLVQRGMINVAIKGRPNASTTYYDVPPPGWMPPRDTSAGATILAPEGGASATISSPDPSASATNSRKKVAQTVAQIVAPMDAQARTEEVKEEVKEKTKEQHQSEGLIKVVDAYGQWKKAAIGDELTSSERETAARVTSDLIAEDYFRWFQADLIRWSDKDYQDPLKVILGCIAHKRHEFDRNKTRFNRINYAFEAVRAHIRDMATESGWKPSPGSNSPPPRASASNSPDLAKAESSLSRNRVTVPDAGQNLPKWPVVMEALVDDSRFGERASFVLRRLSFGGVAGGKCLLMIPPSLSERFRSDFTSGRQLQLSETVRSFFGPNVTIEYRHAPEERN